MNLLAVGCNFRSAPVEIRERIAFDENRLPEALSELNGRYNCESIILSTCNRVELYLGRATGEFSVTADHLAEFIGLWHALPPAEVRPHLYEYTESAAVQHLFRVICSLDSLIVGEGQIAAQVRKSHELSQQAGGAGPMLNTLFLHAVRVGKRVRTETGISHGHVSVSSVAVDYVRQVFDRFHDKTVMVIGAGKMGRLTLKHLQDLKPRRIFVTNRSPEKASEVAQECGGQAIPWSDLDSALIEADIVLSTTGSPDLIMTEARFAPIRSKRTRSPLVIIDIAVPRDFDPAIHDGETALVFNIDDLQRIREQTIAKRHKHIHAAESIIEQERKKFVEDWTRRRNGPVIAKLTQEFDAKRKAVVDHLLSKLNGKLSDDDRAYIEGAFRLFQNQLLHPPIDALKAAAQEGGSGPLIEAVRKLFKLPE